MKKTIIIGAIVLLLLIVLGNSFYTVEENEYACTFRFSEIINTESSADKNLLIFIFFLLSTLIYIL